MAIDRAKFAQECVRQGVLFGVEPHYMLAVAQFRSAISDDRKARQIGPFRLTQAEWNANRDDDACDVHFTPAQISSPAAQCAVFAIMTRHAFDAFVAKNHRDPSPEELYLQKWAAAKAPAGLQQALDETAGLLGPAASLVLDHTQTVATITKVATSFARQMGLPPAPPVIAGEALHFGLPSADAEGSPAVAAEAKPPYQPGPEAAKLLGGVMALIQKAKPIDFSFKGVAFLATLPDGQLIVDSELQLDTDGADVWFGDSSHVDQTSYRYADNSSINANTVPYYALPRKAPWVTALGIKLGDLAAVVYKNRLAFAAFADLGPQQKLGQGSIELHRRLGFERADNGRITDTGIGAGVITIVFPGSGLPSKPSDQKSLLAHIESNGKTLFQKIGGKVSS